MAIGLLEYLKREAGPRLAIGTTAGSDSASCGLALRLYFPYDGPTSGVWFQDLPQEGPKGCTSGVDPIATASLCGRPFEEFLRDKAGKHVFNLGGSTFLAD
jgi:hypothetical protein